MNSFEQSRDFVLQTAKANINRIKAEPGYVEQAKQINGSLASIVAMERNAVMLEAIQLARTRGRQPAIEAAGKTLPGLPE